MKFTCNKDDLLNGINIVSKAVSNRTTLPILQCILIQAGTEGFKLTGNDLELGIETKTIDADVAEEGNIAVEAKLLGDIVRRLNGTEITIDANENNNVLLQCGSSQFNIVGQNGDEFPEITRVEQNNPLAVTQKDLRDMINQTIFSVAADESKVVLTGELIEMADESINIVAVDGYRISYKKAALSKTDTPVKVIVPGKTLREIARILNDSDETVHIYVTENHCLFEFEGNVVVSRIIEGEFIKYQQTFTSEYKTKVIAERSELIASLERASLISRDARKVPVKIEITDGRFIIDSQTEMGSAHEEIFVDVEGEALKIAFNPRYLIEALKAVEDEKVAVEFNSSLSPCIIKPIEGDNYKYLILPLRM